MNRVDRLMQTDPSVTVAYLVNQYPGISHTFIRREIIALEARGVDVLRYSIRPIHSPLVDEADRQELTKTRAVLAMGVTGLIVGLLTAACRTPGRWVKALMLAVRLGWRSQRGVARHVIYWAEACVLVGWMKQAKVDHLHAHFGTNPAMVALLCRVLGGPPYSFTVHGPDEFDHAPTLALGQKIAGASFIAAISEFCRSQLYRWCDYQHWSKIHVVRCALDGQYLDETSPDPIDPASRQFVCVGRISEQKGQLLLVEAAHQLKQAGHTFKLVLVGDGPMRSEVEALIERFGLSKEVTITGWANGQVVREQIRKSRVFVLPSFAEGLPVVIMEALAMGRPVISTYVAGIPELVEPGVNGWLVPPGSVDRVAEAMRQSLETPVERLREMGQAGAERVAQRHNVTTEAAKLARHFGCWAVTSLAQDRTGKPPTPSNPPDDTAVAVGEMDRS